MRSACVALLLLCSHAAVVAGFEPFSWAEAEAKASNLVQQMTAEEKYTLMRGIGWQSKYFVIPTLEKWYYVGNTAPIPRLKIPSLNIQDAASGFRTYWPELVGTVTCWPSLLAMAATWDPALVKEFAIGLGREFSGKGANVILGPSVNVHRVARNGRNFEYLSGEDPFLGSRLTKAYVEGVQSQGVMSVAKHFVLNQQETHRETESSNVDDRTLWELYYPPFQAAVDAGVSAVMCSYNGENGTSSCSNGVQLQNLKRKMGFRGFVQSDWWATHNVSVEQGLDQEMPGIMRTWFYSPYFTPKNLAKVNPAAVDDSVQRILASMYRMNLFNTTKCSAPCQELMVHNVSSQANSKLARKAATESIVLLKNNGDLLPLSNTKVKTIAVIGSVAVGKTFNPNSGQGASIYWNEGDYYSGGGSGHITAGHVVTPLAGIKQRAAKSGISVIESATDDVKAAIAAATQADVAIVVAGTSSGEAADRKSLSLDHGADALITAVAHQAKKTLVLTQIPGAVTMPWRDQVDGIATLFLGGEETGSAWAAVIFGDEAPSGRLPIMMPETEADTIAPSSEQQILYSEGLATSYRNPKFKAAFPFGHGLTYTTFDFGKPQFSNLESSDCVGYAFCITSTIKNTGKTAASSVVQLYLEFPTEAGQPSPILKGFVKTRSISPNDTEAVTFRVSDRDVSYWRSGTWTKVQTGIVHIGASSVDIRHSVPLNLEREEVFV